MQVGYKAFRGFPYDVCSSFVSTTIFLQKERGNMRGRKEAGMEEMETSIETRACMERYRPVRQSME